MLSKFNFEIIGTSAFLKGFLYFVRNFSGKGRSVSSRVETKIFIFAKMSFRKSRTCKTRREHFCDFAEIFSGQKEPYDFREHGNVCQNTRTFSKKINEISHFRANEKRHFLFNPSKCVPGTQNG